MELKIALFGGTFDPVHQGHVKAAESVLRFTECKEVWFIPVYWHVSKRREQVSGVEHRKKMIELAIAEREGLRLVDFNRNPTYTIDTIRKARKLHPEHEYVWVIGSDLESEFHLWHDAEQILKETKIILVPEPGFKRLHSPILSEAKGNCIVLWEAERVDLSSTLVRRRIGKGAAAVGLVDERVLDYIKENNLYAPK